MIIYRKELKRATGFWCMWAFALVFIQSFICIFLFQEVKEQISVVNKALESVGEIIAAFGMENLRLDKLTDFYGFVSGLVLEIGGSLFAAIRGAYILQVEEEEYTADFLFTHPVSRVVVLTQKLFSLFTQIIVLNGVVIGAGLLMAKIIGETLEMHCFVLLHIVHLIMQLQISSICFGISSFIKTQGYSIGVAVALVLYAVNIVHNISSKADFLKYVTPYAYCGVGSIFSQSNIQIELIGISIVVGAGGIIIAYLRYAQKDIFVVD